MTILIKGMEMPESCYGCPLSEHREETDMGARFAYMVDCKKNSFDDGTFEGRRKTRPGWCPLIEVPTPHGRLIDADAFIVEQCHECDGCCEDTDCACLDCTSDSRCEFMQDIADAPTVIEAEE